MNKEMDDLDPKVGLVMDKTRRGQDANGYWQITTCPSFPVFVFLKKTHLCFTVTQYILFLIIIVSLTGFYKC